MPKPIIDAAQAVKDIRSGADDTVLMRKYNITAKGVQSLLKKLVSTGQLERAEVEHRLPPGGVERTRASREVSAKAILSDLRSGLDDEEVMRKYKLTAKGLMSLYGQIVDSGLLSEPELRELASDLDETVSIRGAKFLEDLAAWKSAMDAPTEEVPPQAPEVRSDEEGPEPEEEQAVELVCTCPVCEATRTDMFEVCPECGVNVAEYLDEEKATTGASLERTSQEFPDRHGESPQSEATFSSHAPHAEPDEADPSTPETAPDHSEKPPLVAAKLEETPESEAHLNRESMPKPESPGESRLDTHEETPVAERGPRVAVQTSLVCKHCDYYHPLEKPQKLEVLNPKLMTVDATGECRRKPPRPSTDAYNRFFPLVHEDLWCGEGRWTVDGKRRQWGDDQG